MKRRATARWRGNLKSGQGTLSSSSGALKNIPYSFTKRFSDEPGTNPEELIAAAHAGCFAMALSGELEKRKLKAESLEVQAVVSLDQIKEGWTITEAELQLAADVPQADEKDIREAAETAKKNCPVSRLLNAEISLTIHAAAEEPAKAFTGSTGGHSEDEEDSGEDYDDSYISKYSELG